MFREMRRKNQILTAEECADILLSETSGVLAVAGDGGYPYAVPLSYVYHEGRIFFHCARTGHKTDAILRDDKVSFCVIGTDRIVPEEYTTYFRSVIAFGRARILDEEREILEVLRALGSKYSPGYENGISAEIESQIGNVCIVEISVEHMTGKEAIELVRARKSPDGGEQ